MARKLRVQYPGAIYHVMNRGDRREPIFQDDTDRERFLATLGEACVKTGWQVQAYCLMGNHFHLVVETPQANLVAGMKWFLGTYTSRFNRRHKLFGHLFSGRYKSLIVDGSGNGYVRTVCDYVHLNPARAKLVAPEHPLREYRWSSWPAYLMSSGKRPGWLRVQRLLGEYRIAADSAAGRRRLEEALEARRAADEGSDYKPIRRGWFFGDKTLKEELLVAVNAQAGGWHYGEELRESAEAKAERIVAEELKRHQWEASTLAERRKGDAVKLAIARRLREESTMTLAWIAERLNMGTKTHLAHLLYWQHRDK
ncbi:MAG: transposase [Candidatus Hydrogenedentes bacterium]|nr:transposase [Candidatus Hydrogenedentota bacterium]